ncbi:hypothetical protein EDB86DRAFT_569871 [Lactarius hatsudake]|nr:hypothetical protein EDB86DRAFT_569871 [Lactarius hatsudake]
MIHLLIPGLIFSLFHYARAQQTFYPAAIPLFVRSPYLNCWGYLSNEPSNPKISQTTTFFDVQQPRSGWDPSLEVLNLVVLVRVDNSTYLFLGNASTVNTTVNFTNVAVSPTQTKLTAEAGPMQINLTFLNPIEREDWVKQSIPFSYMTLTAESRDGTAHAMQVYSDLTLRWSSETTQFSWQYPTAGTVAIDGHFNYAILPQPEWGTLYYGMQSGVRGDITTNISDVPASRDLFRLNGVLGSLDQIKSTAQDFDSTVFAISRDLGTIQATKDPVISIIGYDVNLVMNYTDLSGATQKRKSLYQDKYGGKGDILVHFISDFANASSRAQELDLKVLQQASPISGPLGDLVSLATAQVYGSFHLTYGIDADGDFNKSDVMAFMRNMGGSSTNRVNAVETLYSAFPAFMYIDPGLGGLFLEPLLRLQASQLYTYPYAAADIGTNYPDVTLTNSAHNQGVEQSGNMLIMTYAHARASGDVGLISRYYDAVLISWANYLSNATLLVRDQSSADGLSADNQTDLAIKGIIAIEAMSKMSSIVKRDADVDKYSSTAASLYAQWKSLALTSDNHLLATYEQVGSWTLGYNLFADVWLNTSVVKSSVYDGQSTFINNTLTLNFSNSGMPVDNLGSDVDNPGPVSGWSMFAAAMMPNQDQRTNLISRVHNRESTYPLTPFGQSDLHPTISGGGPSPAQGAMYAPLALEAPVVLIAAGPTATGTSSTPHTRRSVITKGVIGGVAALLAIGAIALVVWHQRRRGYRRTPASAEPSFPSGVVSEVTVTPFDPTGTAIARHLAGPQTDSQQLLLHRPSSRGDSPLPLRGAVTIPVGLSDKELARLRSLANGSRSQPTDGQPSNHLLTVTTATDRGELGGVAGVATSSSEAQRLQLENNFLRHEIRQLHVEGFPPSYASDTGIAS